MPELDNTITASRSSRNSGIELLKIIAIFLIVLNHCIQSLCEVNPAMPAADYVIDINSATTNIVNLLLAIFRSSGCIGNDIFVVCSAWFLLDSRRADKKKAAFLIANIWTVSVIIWGITRLAGLSITREETLKQFFPTANANNWFLTCYLLFFLLHPLLNRLIEMMTQKTLLAVSAFLVFLYSLCQYFRPWFFEGNLFYMTDLVVWIMIYFVVAYIKKYVKDRSENVKANVIALLIGIAGQALMIVLINLAGLRFFTFHHKLLYYNYGGSPFIILIALSALNLARRSHLKSRFINYVSGLSLLIYIIHENVILRTYYRPRIFMLIHEQYGYDHILLWLFGTALAIMIAAAISAAVYSQTIERLVRPVSHKLYDLLAKLYRRIEAGLLKVH